MTELNSTSGRARFFQRLTESLVQLDRQAGQLTDQAGFALLGESADRDVRSAGGLVEGLFGGRRP